MPDIGFRAKLETGEAIANANQLTRALDSLARAMENATVSGDADAARKYGEIMLKTRRQMLAESRIDEGRDRRTPEMRIVQGVTKFLGRGPGYIGAAGGGNAAGAALGAAGDSAGLLETIKGLPPAIGIGGAVLGGLVALAAGANKLSEQFEKVMKPSMDLAAVLGMIGNDARKNSAAFSEALNMSASKAIKYGYSIEEGIKVTTDLGRMGVKKANVYGAEEDVFRFARPTGADIGSLTQAKGLAQRYDPKSEVLALAYGGTLASGMEKGQYQEYLSATLRIFEEGLSRGVVKGFGEITRTQNALATIGTAWKGELGAQRYSQMNDAVKDAGNLDSDFDIVMYRAAQNTIAEEKANGPKGKEWGKYKDLESTSYVDVRKTLEAGLTPELLGNALKMADTMGGGSRTETLRLIMGMLHLNMTGAEQLYDKRGNLTDAMSVATNPEYAKTNEEKLLSATEQIKLDLANIGKNFIEYKSGALKFLEGILGGIAGDKMLATYQIETGKSLGNMLPSESGQNGFEEFRRVRSVISEALKNKDQPDKNGNGIGDYADNAILIQNMLGSMDPEKSLYLNTHPETAKALFAPFKSPSDFTDENTKSFLGRISASPQSADPGGQYLQSYGLGDSFMSAYKQNNPIAKAIAESLKDTWGNSPSLALTDPGFAKFKEGAGELAKKGSWDDVLALYKKLYHRPGKVAESYALNKDEDRWKEDKLIDFSQNVRAMAAKGSEIPESLLIKTIGENLSYLSPGLMNNFYKKATSTTDYDKKNEISAGEFTGFLRELVGLLQGLKDSGVRISDEAVKFLGQNSKISFEVVQ